MIPIPTNATITIKRKGSNIQSNVLVNIQPAAFEVAMNHEIPAAKAHKVFFQEIVDVKEQDFLVDGSKNYRVAGVEHWNTTPGAHSEATVEAKWGTD